MLDTAGIFSKHGGAISNGLVTSLIRPTEQMSGVVYRYRQITTEGHRTRSGRHRRNRSTTRL